MNSENYNHTQNIIKPDTKTKTNCLNNYYSYLLCRGLAKDMYWDSSSCKELENFLLSNCENKSYINKCIYTNK